MPVLVVTSVAGPTPALAALADGARRHGVDLVLVGDEQSPPDFRLDGCDFYGLDRQLALGLELPRLCPLRSYARKNVGYLVAMLRGADTILETDDDSAPYPRFWQPRHPLHVGAVAAGCGWVNVYRWFTGARIWPRGFPLDEARAPAPPLDRLPAAPVVCPIQQGLVDDDPDVDAVYRLLLDLPFRFDDGPDVALTAGSWCPFNSQNTAWWPEAYPLLYLPATCSFRLTDIWRSFVAQRIAWANGWGVRFHAATISQRRNPHDLMRDFHDEVDGYLGNRALCAVLDALELAPGVEHLPANMRVAYCALVERGWLDACELPLLDAWLADVAAARVAAAPASAASAETTSAAPAA